jgi:hypothetical protein
MFVETRVWSFCRVQVAYMCDMNVAASTYYHGGMPVATTNADKMDKMTRTVREMTEAQRESY